MKYMLMLQMMLMGPMSKPDEPKMRMSLWAWGAYSSGDMSGVKMKYMLMLQMILGKPDEPMMRMSLWAWRACISQGP